MSSKTMCIMKALFFLFLAVILVIIMTSGERKTWHFLGLGMCAFLIIAYLRQAFDR